ncbi:LytTR family DNA-binding domain-containing protein [Chitinophaga pendula]|uniref:LytR/AlgR family response regulator transcription factor n=1 Tax=Chitinophaga TaxID=79328 RepID=UPI000BAEC8B6|nr:MULTISPECIES: LytTR family DNA-binding domain-containing protein [Chitinophaga]ASZ11678.1 DNA-binding response regulator [Chitinophaga sp. MD30]UCJ05309.1 LytTR family DNA-binding domain-containing protein [Chitinophaga pendula]
MNLRCIIVDDEPNAVNLLEMLITQTTSWELTNKCYDALEALTYLREHPVDFLFLDINMPQLSGIDLATLLPPDIAIVFTTAYAEHAADSYNFTTIDYLLKPITLKRFISATQKINAYFSFRTNNTIPSPAPLENYFFAKSGKSFRKLLLEDILYFEGEKEYVRIVTATEQLLVYRRLKDIEAQLQPPFVRVHQSYIVNITQLDKFQDNLIYINNKQLPVSEKFKEGFMAMIRQRLL